MKILRVNQLLCIAVAFILLAVWVLPGSCAPAEQRNVYRILSENSGKHVGVTRGGRVHAHANHPSKFDSHVYYPIIKVSHQITSYQ